MGSGDRRSGSCAVRRDARCAAGGRSPWRRWCRAGVWSRQGRGPRGRLRSAEPGPFPTRHHFVPLNGHLTHESARVNTETPEIRQGARAARGGQSRDPRRGGWTAAARRDRGSPAPGQRRRAAQGAISAWALESRFAARCAGACPRGPRSSHRCAQAAHRSSWRCSRGCRRGGWCRSSSSSGPGTLAAVAGDSRLRCRCRRSGRSTMASSSLQAWRSAGASDEASVVASARESVPA
jgi:hypothetical protein